MHVREGQALAFPLCSSRSPEGLARVPAVRKRVKIWRSCPTEVGPVPVGRGPVPRHARGDARSRGTGPRSLSVDCDRQSATRSGSGDPELQTEGPVPVGRGPVPRHARGDARSRGPGPRVPHL